MAGKIRADTDVLIGYLRGEADVVEHIELLAGTKAGRQAVRLNWTKWLAMAGQFDRGHGQEQRRYCVDA